MRNLIYCCLIVSLIYSTNGEEANSGNPLAGYIPSGMSFPFGFDTFKKCYEYASQQFQSSGYIPGSGQRDESSNNTESGGSMLSNAQFQDIFKACMEGEKTSSYKKRSAEEANSGNPLAGYIPSGMSFPFGFDTFKKCYEYASQQFQSSGYIPGSGQRDESSNNTESGGSMLSNAQFQDIFKACMEGEKASSYKKRSAEEANSGNPLAGYIPSGMSFPFGFDTFKKCYEYASQQFQSSSYIPGSGQRDESSNNTESGGSMLSNAQFQDIFKSCMEGEKASSYKKRSAEEANSGNPLAGYIPSGMSFPFGFDTFKKCYEYASQQVQSSGYIPGSGQRDESSNNTESGGSMLSNAQFQDIFKACMEGEKASSYKKRSAEEANSGNPLAGYIPSGMSFPFGFDTFKKCYEYASQQVQSSGYIPGSGQRDESSNNTESGGSMLSNAQFQDIFKACMEGEKASSYKKRSAEEANSGNPLAGYIPSGMSFPFGFDTFKKCYEYASQQFQSSGYIPGSGQRDESSNNTESGGSMLSNAQFQDIFKACMEGEKASSYKKRSAEEANSGNPLSGYIPSGMSFPFGFDTFKKCYEYASQQVQSSGYIPGSGQRDESSNNTESGGSMLSNAQFQDIFKACMEGEKASSYKKRSAEEANSGNPLAGYIPSGMSFPFGFDTFKKCYEYASQQFQSSGYIPGSGQRDESSNNTESGGSMLSNAQFQDIFKACMEGEKASSYKKRSAEEANSGNPLAGYIPSGMSFPFGFDTFKKCYEYASQQFQSSGYIPGSGQRDESSNNTESGGSMLSNAQFQDIFKACMEGEKASSYKKRSAEEANSGNPLSGYIPSGMSFPFGFDTFKKCYEYASQQFQSSSYIPGSGQRDESSNNTESGGSMLSNAQFQDIFKACMEREKPSSSRSARNSKLTDFEKYKVMRHVSLFY